MMQLIKKIDIIAALLAGALIAIFLWIVALNIGEQDIWFLHWSIFIILPALAVAGIFVAAALSRWLPQLWQVSKFILVGALNTFVDLGVFNLLKAGFGVFEAGALMTFFKGVSFIAAVINSFLWNKWWVFESKKSKRVTREFGAFFIVSAIGIMLNAAFFYFLTVVMGPPGGMDSLLWHNVAVILAGLAIFVWNFLGYKFIVFRVVTSQAQ